MRALFSPFFSLLIYFSVFASLPIYLKWNDSFQSRFSKNLGQHLDTYLSEVFKRHGLLKWGFAHILAFWLTNFYTLRGLKHIYFLKVSVGQVPGQILAGSAQGFMRLQSGSHPALSSHLEVCLGKDTLPSSLRLLSESFSCAVGFAAACLAKASNEKRETASKTVLNNAT